MRNDSHSDILIEMKRYLSRKRMEGRGVIHRLDDAGFSEGEAAPGAAFQTPIHAGVSGCGSKDGQAGGRSDAPGGVSERRESPVSFRNSAGSADLEPGKARGDSQAVRRIGCEEERGSIRYRRELRAASQSNLFSGGEEVEEPDLGGLDLESLEKMVSTCTCCHLSEGRTQAVFGSGDPNAKIVFIGEAPGREEDLQGLPFVGRAGKLLTKILSSIGFTRDEVYITNILKCRPPENRDPREDEVKACEVYLRRQLELINPVLICALGRIAGQNLLKSNASLSFLRQGVHYYNDTRVLVTYHPAALLRNPKLKKEVWEDVKRVLKVYEDAMGGI